MSEHGVLALCSLLLVVGSLAVAVWLVASGQAVNLDGLFMLAACLVVALAFGLCLRSLAKGASKAQSGPASAASAKAGAAAQEKADTV